MMTNDAKYASTAAEPQHRPPGSGLVSLWADRGVGPFPSLQGPETESLGESNQWHPSCCSLQALENHQILYDVLL